MTLPPTTIKKIGITGQRGFIGYHLYHTLKLQADPFELVQFDRSFFDDDDKLDGFVSQCDVIVHLAALNRHNDPQMIYAINTGLVKKLIASLFRTNAKPHLIMTSSTHEDQDSYYGRSKKEGRERLSAWSEKSGGVFTGMIIPNVYGPFAHPRHNSVVATFCHQLAHDEVPEVAVDRQMHLIYVAELVGHIIKAIQSVSGDSAYRIAQTAEVKVSEILSLLEHYRMVYQQNGEIPKLSTPFEHNLFNTYRCYMPKSGYFPRQFVKHSDPRGQFVELARLGISGQVSFSTTLPGITRGNHFHTRKIERFAVIKGEARIQLRQIGSDEVLDFYLDGQNPSYVDMPIWHTHNITNIGEDELITVFWIDEPYDPNNADTYPEEV